MNDHITLDIPAPDHDGFVSWVENEYSDDRYSAVSATTDPKTGGRVSVRSGEHPAYTRFIKDLRPKLHEHGFVISSATKDKFSTHSDHDTTHSITAIPLLWVVAYVNGYVCRRGACRRVTSEVYCDGCRPYMDDHNNAEKPRMIHP